MYAQSYKWTINVSWVVIYCKYRRSYYDSRFEQNCWTLSELKIIWDNTIGIEKKVGSQAQRKCMQYNTISVEMMIVND